VTRLGWTGDALVPCTDQGDVRIVDSWLVTDGKARALTAHLHRFTRSCASLYGVRADLFACAAVTAVPATGRWFPRLELAVSGDGDVRLRIWLRPAPALGSTLRLWRPPEPDQRSRPRVKGPDLAYLAGLRDAAQAAGADEAVLVSASGYVLEGASTSLLWWRGDTLCAPPPDTPVLPSVTRAVLLEAAAGRGIRVRYELVTPDELRSLPVWAVNALHGIRPAMFLPLLSDDFRA
jgi:branched-subunit amino acid aminotransferase/4-amino-4-deoxychorismate lyase